MDMTMYINHMTIINGSVKYCCCLHVQEHTAEKSENFAK